jgi:hypothetical protein
MILTPNDREFVEMLCGRVRCASEAQHEAFAALRGIKNPKAARRRRYFLVGSGLLKFAVVPARPGIRLCGPLFTWMPGDPGPDVQALSYAAERRSSAPLASTRIYYASPKAVRLFGGPASGAMPNPQQVAHDVCVTDIYLSLLADDPEVAALYRGEDQMKDYPQEKPYRVKHPDAFLCDEQGRPCIAIEFVGLYPAERLAAFHEDMKRRGLGYELW